MSKFQVTFEFEAGEETCAVEPRKFCRWDTNGDGQCKLFGVKIFGGKPSFAKVEESNWIMRANECLEHGRKIKEC